MCFYEFLINFLIMLKGGVKILGGPSFISTTSPKIGDNSIIYKHNYVQTHRISGKPIISIKGVPETK